MSKSVKTQATGTSCFTYHARVHLQFSRTWSPPNQDGPVVHVSTVSSLKSMQSWSGYVISPGVEGKCSPPGKSEAMEELTWLCCDCLLSPCLWVSQAARPHCSHCPPWADQQRQQVSPLCLIFHSEVRPKHWMLEAQLDVELLQQGPG